jgi:2-methylaconitate isomerase
MNDRVRADEIDRNVQKVVMSRSARVLMEGWVRVPGDCF